jgi:hypothetical protein
MSMMFIFYFNKQKRFVENFVLLPDQHLIFFQIEFIKKIKFPRMLLDIHSQMSCEDPLFHEF